MQTISEIVDAFGGPTEFGKACGFKENPASRGSDMRRRNSIPVDYWSQLIRAAESKGLSISYETLVEIHAQRSQAAE